MKKRISLMLLILVILSVLVNEDTTYSQTVDNNNIKQSPFEVDTLKNKLSKIIKNPFFVESNDSTIVINFPQVIKTTDEYLKDQLYMIGNYLVRHKICPEVVIASWKNPDSNYAYKASITKEDLVSFRNGEIKLNDLYSKMSVAKSEMQKQDDTLMSTLDKPVATNPQENKDTPESQKIATSPEPTLKPFISVDKDKTETQEITANKETALNTVISEEKNKAETKEIATNNETTPKPVVSENNEKIAAEPVKETQTDVVKPAATEAPEEAAKREDTVKADEGKLIITPTEESKDVSSNDDASKPDLKPRIPPEGFYTPILKTVISNDFNVQVENNVVLINITGKPISDDKSLRAYAYRIFNQVIRVNPSLDKISISWQPEEGAFGKTASIAGIYIKDYFRKKITQDELKEVILVDSIEPTSRHLNDVPKIALIDVPIENLRKAKELREAGIIYMQNSKEDSAIRTFKQAIKFNPNDFLSYYWLGELYIKKEDYDDAQEALTKSVSINPGFRRADEALAKIKSK